MGSKNVIEKMHKVRNASRPEEERASTVQQLVLTAAGAAGSALLGAILARRGWEPSTVSGTLAGLGAALAGVGDNDALRAIGAGAMSASGAQLVLMVFSEYENRKSAANDATTAPPTAVAPVGPPPAEDKAANANVLPLAPKAVAS